MMEEVEEAKKITAVIFQRLCRVSSTQFVRSIPFHTHNIMLIQRNVDFKAACHFY